MAIAALVEDWLAEHDVKGELVPHKGTGSTHESAVAAEVPEDHIAKAIVVRDRDGEAMVVIPGHLRLDLSALNQQTGRSFRLDDESDLGDLFPDCVPGAVPAIGPAYGMETFVDDGIGGEAEVYFEAGDHRHLVRVTGTDLRALLKGAHTGGFSRGM